VHFLDNVIEVNKYPLPKIQELTKANRKIGLGVMGFADMLIGLGISYNSEEAVQTAEEVMAFIQKESKAASAHLGETRGNFPNYKGSAYDRPDTPFMRNATTTTVAPTGTISIIGSCSSGIEPLFAISFVRKVLDNEELLEVQPLSRSSQRGRDLFEELIKRIAATWSIKDFTQKFPKMFPRFRGVSHDASPERAHRIQAAFKTYDNAVSKDHQHSSPPTVEE
jgi:ribonucleoside-diphosphate reductase alpha chain